MVRVSARCNAIPLTKWFVAWKRSRPLRVWQYRLQGILRANRRSNQRGGFSPPPCAAPAPIGAHR